MAAVSAPDRAGVLAEIERSSAKPRKLGRFLIEVDESGSWERAGLIGFQARNRRGRNRHLGADGAPSSRPRPRHRLRARRVLERSLPGRPRLPRAGAGDRRLQQEGHLAGRADWFRVGRKAAACLLAPRGVNRRRPLRPRPGGRGGPRRVGIMTRRRGGKPCRHSHGGRRLPRPERGHPGRRSPLLESGPGGGGHPPGMEGPGRRPGPAP